MATTSAHLIARIYEILCDGAGVARALPTTPTDYTFQRLTTSLQNASDLAVRAKVKPIAQVIIDPIAADVGAADELSSAHHYTLTVRVVRRYYFGTAGDASAMEAAQVRAFDDYCRTRAALCHPSNLVATESGSATGIGGPALTAADGVSQARNVETLSNGRDRLLTMTDTYRAVFAFSPDG